MAVTDVYRTFNATYIASISLKSTGLIICLPRM